MRICIPCNLPGGPEAVVSAPFEEADLLDYYELHPDGNFEHEAEMRSCPGGCIDPIEAIVKRGTVAVVIVGIRPSSLLRFWNAGVKVYHASDPSVRVLLDLLAAGKLDEIKIDRYAKMEKNKS